MNLPRALKPRTACVLAVLALAALASSNSLAKSSDRNQPMTLESANSDCNLADTSGSCVFTGDVEIVQGTLLIRAARAEVQRRNGDIHQVILTGKQATMRQEMDDGSTMNARADRIVYEPSNYHVESPRGSNSGQRMVYNMSSGQMQSGGDGSRVRTVIQPRSQSGESN